MGMKSSTNGQPVKLMSKTKRKYILFGHLTGKYRGDDTISNDISKYRNFDINLYDISVDQARIRDRKEIIGEFAGQPVKELFPTGKIKVKPSEEDTPYLISPRQISIITPTLRKISKSGHQIHGEISGMAFFDVTQKEFEYQPVKLPFTSSSEININFNEIEPPPTLNTQPGGTKFNVFEAFWFLLLTVIAVIFTYSIFSVIPSLVIIVFCVIGLFLFILSIIPSNWLEWIQKYLISPLFILALGLGGVTIIITLVLSIVPTFAAYAYVSLTLFLLYLLAYFRVVLKLLAILGIILLLFYIPILINPVGANTNKATYNPLPYQPKEELIIEPIVPQDRVVSNDTLMRTLEWQGPNKERYKIQYPIIKNEVQASGQQRQSIDKVITEDQDFHEVFSSALYQEAQKTQPFLTALDSVRATNDMDRRYFRRVLINLVQQIEYYPISTGPCQNASENCIPNIKYGFYTPVEFLYHLQGDCDTKALLLYFILEEFNFDVAVMGSLFYQHAMIALPSTEKDKAYHFMISGEKFYPVEVTMPGWEIGEMPPLTRDKNFWTPILISD
jgi:hypothetical protein